MSLIHEALEKLELEKKMSWKKPVPEVSERKEQTTRNNSRVIYGIAGFLLFSFVVGLVYFLTASQRLEELPKESPEKSAPVFNSSSKQNRFFLTGLTRMGSDWTAIVNNKLVRVGDRVNGATVESIREEGVILNFGGQTITLSLHGDSPVHLTHLEIAS